MKRIKLFNKSLVIMCLMILMLSLFAIEVNSSDDINVLLTWEENPQTSQTITWISDNKTSDYYLYYSESNKSENKFIKLEPQKYTFEGTANWVYTARLDELTENQRYKVKIKDADIIIEEFYFETLPADDSFTFVAGADSRTDADEPVSYRRYIRRYINRKAAAEKPAFVAFGGDLVNRPLSDEEWNWWLEDWSDLLITDDGRRIPIIPAIGNHEVSGGYFGDKDDARFYYNYFNLPGNEKYYALELSSEVVFITLDSDHTTRVEGEQTEWLAETLEKYQDKKRIIVQYHLSAFPSRRDFYRSHFNKMREFWVPLFEKYGVELVFEAHDHTFKITEPLRIGHISIELREKLEKSMNRAEEDFDPDEDYSPWSNVALQQISSGDWEAAGIESIDEAMEEFMYNLSLYYKQNNKFESVAIFGEVMDNPLYSEYWNSKIEEDGGENLIDFNEGIIYFGDGGWGAPLRYPKDHEEVWYLNEAAQAYNFFVVDVSIGADDVMVRPRFFNPRKVKFSEQINFIPVLD